MARKYGPGDKNTFGNKFANLNQAYDQYQKDRTADIENPTLAPKGSFATIWGWGKTPAKEARRVVGKQAKA